MTGCLNTLWPHGRARIRRVTAEIHLVAYPRDSSVPLLRILAVTARNTAHPPNSLLYHID
jgi:hypothetical protein